ncbi:hypothetical protein EVAR_38047_1 [Eumeta japonica]|uniref:Uncharacterized protein n=1 Tax=Eumeta variegata TaxID=151549 RepID=A0A4C1W8D3_EUMVA|nr:hypothetical protein EVAR_38047_1 [Eumeta japonica]
MISPPVGCSLSTVSCGHSSRFAQEIGSVEPSVRFIKVGRRVSCRVISDVQFRRYPPPTFHRRVPPIRLGDERQRFERPWVGADPR